MECLFIYWEKLSDLQKNFLIEGQSQVVVSVIDEESSVVFLFLTMMEVEVEADIPRFYVILLGETMLEWLVWAFLIVEYIMNLQGVLFFGWIVEEELIFSDQQEKKKMTLAEVLPKKVFNFFHWIKNFQSIPGMQ